jgi:hypothetical protein
MPNPRVETDVPPARYSFCIRAPRAARQDAGPSRLQPRFSGHATVLTPNHRHTPSLRRGRFLTPRCAGRAVGIAAWNERHAIGRGWTARAAGAFGFRRQVEGLRLRSVWRRWLCPASRPRARCRARVLSALPAVGAHAQKLRSSGTGFQRASPASVHPLTSNVRSRKERFDAIYCCLCCYRHIRPFGLCRSRCTER